MRARQPALPSPFLSQNVPLAGILTSPGYLKLLWTHGQPRSNLKPYTADSADVNEVAAFVCCEGGAFTWEEVARYRERWKRPLVVKAPSG